MLEPSTFVATLERLWNRSGILLTALSTACLAAFVALVIAARFAPTTFDAASQSTEVWLLPLGISLAVLATFRKVYERNHPALRIVPTENQFFVHSAKQKDGRMTAQIAGHFEVYNLTDKPIVLTDVRSIKPRIHGKLVTKLVNVEDTQSAYWGRYAVPPRMMVRGSFMLIAYEDLSERGPEMDVTVRVSDQFGRWHKITVEGVRHN